jgi:hypothetical protein
MLLSLNNELVAFLDRDSDNEDGGNLLIDIIQHSKTLDAQLPGRQRVGAQLFPVARWDGRLVAQLFFDRVKEDTPITGRERLQVPLGVLPVS